MPNLTGLGVADAQRLAQSMDLEIEVLGEQESTDARPGAVLQQTPTAGTRAPAGSVVSVLVAAGRELELPDVVGYDLETVQDGLENEGLLLVITEVRSTETRGPSLARSRWLDRRFGSAMRSRSRSVGGPTFRFPWV